MELVESMVEHRHLDDDQIDEAARAALDGMSEKVDAIRCTDCQEQVRREARCISLARLLTRDVRDPVGTPAVDAVRAIRRQSYRRRALGELSTMLMTSPLRTRG